MNSASVFYIMLRLLAGCGPESRSGGGIGAGFAHARSVIRQIVWSSVMLCALASASHRLLKRGETRKATHYFLAHADHKSARASACSMTRTTASSWPSGGYLYFLSSPLIN